MSIIYQALCSLCLLPDRRFPPFIWLIAAETVFPFSHLLELLVEQQNESPHIPLKKLEIALFIFWCRRSHPTLLIENNVWGHILAN